MEKSIAGAREKLILLASHHGLPKGGGIGSKSLQDQGVAGARSERYLGASRCQGVWALFLEPWEASGPEWLL